jgi:dTDP-glucose 4,6-dehydratase
MKLLVTGGAGFIGSNFIHYWLREHPADQIVNIDKLTYAGNLQNLENLPPRHELICEDICDAALEERLNGVEAVFHFAAESHVDRSIDSAEVFIRTNVLGTQRLLEAARRCRVPRFVLVSTDEVYGALGSEGECAEDAPLSPNSPYAASKAAADLLARAYFKTHQFPVIVTRCCNNYGPFQHPEKLIPLMTTNALAGIPLPVYGKGEQVREWIHAEDHCRALEAVFRNGSPGEVYNVGTAERLSNLELVRTILRLLGKPADLIQFVADRPGHDFRYALNCDKTCREVGWKPRISFETGLAETLTWYRDNRAWVDSARNDSYQKYYSERYENREQHLKNL